MIPYFTEQTDIGSKTSDVFSRLLEERVIFVGGEVESNMANSIVAQLILLEQLDPEADITMYINSPGGSVIDGFAITDTMEFVSCDIATIGIGQQSSMGSFILASGTKGKRAVLKRSAVMIHRLSAGVSGDYHTMNANFENIKSLNDLLEKEYERLSYGKTDANTFRELLRYENFLTPKEAIDIGIVDYVIEKREMEDSNE